LAVSSNAKTEVFIGEDLSKVKVIFESLNNKYESLVLKVVLSKYETNTSINNEVVENFIW
jgi:hypothetical protein